MTHRAVVVFLGRELVDGAAWWSWFLKPGFIHCFVLLAINGDERWIKIEGIYGRLRVTQIPLGDDEREHYVRYVARGATVIKTDVQSEMLIWPLMNGEINVRTCVSVIKSLLGIRSWAVTPWQLYKHLRK